MSSTAGEERKGGGGTTPRVVVDDDDEEEGSGGVMGWGMGVRDVQREEAGGLPPLPSPSAASCSALNASKARIDSAMASCCFFSSMVMMGRRRGGEGVARWSAVESRGRVARRCRGGVVGSLVGNGGDREGRAGLEETVTSRWFSSSWEVFSTASIPSPCSVAAAPLREWEAEECGKPDSSWWPNEASSTPKVEAVVMAVKYKCSAC